MLTVISDFKAAYDARERLNKALLLLTQAQVEVAEAARTLVMFEANFRYKEDKEVVVSTTTALDNNLKRFKPPKYNWAEVTGRKSADLCYKFITQDESTQCYKPKGHPEPCQSY